MGCVFFQAEDGIRYLVRSRGLGDVYKRQVGALGLHSKRPGRLSLDRERIPNAVERVCETGRVLRNGRYLWQARNVVKVSGGCLLYTSDAADERSSVDLGGRRILKKKTHESTHINL